MARIGYWQYFVDKKGRPLKEVEVRVYLAGTLTEADIYLNPTFGSITKSSTEDLKTDKYGFVQFWIGDEWEIEGGYESNQQFKIVVQNTIDSVEEIIDNLFVFAPVRPVNVSNDIIGIPSNKDKDKVISNTQGYSWNTHVDSIVPSASPHNLQPVEYFNLDDTQNRVVSNKLGYQMYQMANTASTTPIDISASNFYSEEVSSWTASGSLYYTDVTHNLTNSYPIVKVVKASPFFNRDFEVVPDKIESINYNVVRVWLATSITVRIAVFG